MVATISISRYTLRFRGVDNTEEVICGFLPRPVADRDKSKCGCCYIESKVVVFSQGHVAPARVMTMIAGTSVSAWKFSLRDYGLAYLMQ